MKLKTLKPWWRKSEWHEDQHPRDHGKFSSKPGNDATDKEAQDHFFAMREHPAVKAAGQLAQDVAETLVGPGKRKEKWEKIKEQLRTSPIKDSLKQSAQSAAKELAGQLNKPVESLTWVEGVADKMAHRLMADMAERAKGELSGLATSAHELSKEGDGTAYDSAVGALAITPARLATAFNDATDDTLGRIASDSKRQAVLEVLEHHLLGGKRSQDLREIHGGRRGGRAEWWSDQAAHATSRKNLVKLKQLSPWWHAPKNRLKRFRAFKSQGDEAERINLIADVMYHVFGKEAVSLFDHKSKGWDSAAHPRDDSGRFGSGGGSGGGHTQQREGNPQANTPNAAQVEAGKKKATSILGRFSEGLNNLIDRVPLVGTIKRGMQKALGKIHDIAAKRYGPKTAKAIMASGVMMDVALMGGGALLTGVPIVTGFNQLLGIIPAFVVAETVHQVGKLTKSDERELSERELKSAAKGIWLEIRREYLALLTKHAGELRATKSFKESDHPRADDGRFGSKPGEGVDGQHDLKERTDKPKEKPKERPDGHYGDKDNPHKAIQVDGQTHYREQSSYIPKVHEHHAAEWATWMEQVAENLEDADEETLEEETEYWSEKLESEWDKLLTHTEGWLSEKTDATNAELVAFREEAQNHTEEAAEHIANGDWEAAGEALERAFDYLTDSYKDARLAIDERAEAQDQEWLDEISTSLEDLDGLDQEDGEERAAEINAELEAEDEDDGNPYRVFWDEDEEEWVHGYADDAGNYPGKKPEVKRLPPWWTRKHYQTSLHPTRRKAGFKESDHPRADDGKFGSKPGEGVDGKHDLKERVEASKPEALPHHPSRKEPSGWGDIGGDETYDEPKASMSDADMDNARKREPLPIPNKKGGGYEIVQEAWDDVSKLWPEMAEKVTKITTYSLAQVPKGVEPPNAFIDPKTGVLAVHPEKTLTAETLWHELVHIDQHERGILKPRHEMEPDAFNALEQEAIQRAKHSEKLVERMRGGKKRFPKSFKPWWVRLHSYAKIG
jgi:hypothetical protein